MVSPNRLEDEWSEAVERAYKSFFEPCVECLEPTILKGQDGKPLCLMHQPIMCLGVGSRGGETT